MLAVTVEASALKKAVPILKSLGLGRSTIPILNCVKITVKNSIMEIEATNLDQGCKVSVPASGEGAWCLNFAKLQAALSAVPDGAMLGISGDSIAKIESGKIKATIASMPIVDFPDWSKTPTDQHLVLTMDAERFGDAFGRVAWSVDDVRHGLKGVHIACKQKDGPVTIEATNGHTLCHIHAKALSSAQFEILLSADCLSAISALASRDGELSLYKMEGSIVASVGNVQWSSKMIDADYPDVAKYIAAQKTDAPQHSFDTKGLASAIKAASGIEQGVKRDSESVRLKGTSAGASITAYGEAGEAIDIPLDSDCASDFEAWANPSYLLRVLGSSGAETAQIQITDNSVFFPDTGNGFVGIVMQKRPPAADRIAA